MAESIILPQSATKSEIYQGLLPQLKALTDGEPNLVANLANITAALKEAFDFFWVGFYVVEGEQLVLGPFQGPVACTRIAFGRGVCGTAWKKKNTINVPDVNQFPGHIACSEHSKSEIVVPIIKDGNVKLVLDIDSSEFSSFNEVDEKYLNELAALIANFV